MRIKIPHFGEHAGKMCRVLPDGSLEPLPEIDTSKVSPPVALPPVEFAPVNRSGIEVPGEISGYNTRDNIAAMAANMEKHGFSNARERAHATALRWEQGIRSGQIRRK